MTNDVWPGLTIAPVRRRPLALVEIEIMENFAWVGGLIRTRKSDGHGERENARSSERVPRVLNENSFSLRLILLVCD
jgi:hypothetical protein